MFNFFKKKDSELKALREENALLRSRLTQGNIPEEELPERWKPELDQDYWSINAVGLIRILKWKNSSTDNTLYDLCNVFKTEEEATEEFLRRKYTQLYHSYGRLFNAERSNYIVGYDDSTKTLCIGESYVHTQGTVYFDSESQVKKVIDLIGESNIIKYVLCEDVSDILTSGIYF